MKRSEILLMTLQVPIDLLLLVLAGVSAYKLRFLPEVLQWRPVLFTLPLQDFTNLVFWFSLIWIAILALLGTYNLDQNKKIVTDIKNIFYGSTVGLGMVATYALFFNIAFDSRFLIIFSYLFALLYLTISHLIVRSYKILLYKNGVGQRRVVLIGNDEIAKTISHTVEKRKDLGYQIVATFPRFSNRVPEKLNHLSVDEIIFTNPRSNEKDALRAIEYSNQHHIVFKYSADLFATYSSLSTIQPLAGIPIIEIKKTTLGAWGRVIKRLFDIVTSLVVLILFSPIYLLVSIAILIETGSPIIYKNERVGILGKHFFVYKFRSMFQKDSTGSQFGKSGEAALKREKKLIKKLNTKQGPIYKIGKDPRVTALGDFLRKTSLDEIPQFVNVLVGDMSIVGPRPHQPREVQKYKADYIQIFNLKPGITGLAQISGRSDLSFEEEMTLDVFYTEHWSLFLDVIICLKTPFILLKKRKAS